jgi:hypothetical protein
MPEIIEEISMWLVVIVARLGSGFCRSTISAALQTARFRNPADLSHAARRGRIPIEDGCGDTKDTHDFRNSRESPEE